MLENTKMIDEITILVSEVKIKLLNKFVLMLIGTLEE